MSWTPEDRNSDALWKMALVAPDGVKSPFTSTVVPWVAFLLHLQSRLRGF